MTKALGKVEVRRRNGEFGSRKWEGGRWTEKAMAKKHTLPRRPFLKTLGTMSLAAGIGFAILIPGRVQADQKHYLVGKSRQKACTPSRGQSSGDCLCVSPLVSDLLMQITFKFLLRIPVLV